MITAGNGSLVTAPLLALILLVPTTALADEGAQDEANSPPGIVDLRIQFGVAPYRSAGCQCFDRTMWTGSAGLAARVRPTVALEAEYRRGAIVLPHQGQLDVHAAALGVRLASHPHTEALWAGFFARVGYQALTLEQPTRQDFFHGLYTGLGFEHGLGFWQHHLRLEHEVPLTVTTGSLAHTTIGFRSGIVFRW